MALNQVALLGPRHEPQKQEEPKKDIWDKILQGIQIADTVTGVASNFETFQNKRLENASLEDKKAGRMNAGELTELQKTHDLNDSPLAGSVKVLRRGDDGTDTPMFASVRQRPVVAAQPKQVDPIAEGRLKLEQERFAYQQQRDKAAAKATAATPPPGQAPAVKLNAEERKRLDSASMGLSAVKDMGDALSTGSNTFSLVGDNDFTAARTRFEEALGRMQSGGAINNDEAARFREMAPTWRDNPEMQQKKMQEIYREMALRVETLGADPAEILAKRKNVEVPAFGKAKQPPGEAVAAPSGPVKGEEQDGFIFQGGDPADPKNWKPKGAK
jgi:hypothetical protein